MSRAIAVSVASFSIAALGGCQRNAQKSPAAAKAESRRHQAACASTVAYDRLKNVMFDEAIAKGAIDRTNLDTLADYSVVRMENPVVTGWNQALDITQCKGRFVLEVPPGAQAGLGGQRQLQADIEYTAQPSADGAGLVYQQRGAEPIVAKLAAFNLNAAAYRPPPAIDEDQPASAPARHVPSATLAASAPTAIPSPKPERPKISQQIASAERRPNVAPLERKGPVAMQPAPRPRSSDEGASAVRRFYGALANGNGTAASAQVIPEKRSSGPFSPGAISRFYGHLAEPLRLTGLAPAAGGGYRVTYRYSAGRSHCNGVALVRVRTHGGRQLISSIRSLTGC